MSKKVKKLIVFVMLVSMLLGNGLNAKAAVHKQGCGSNTSVQVCGYSRTTYASKHKLHTNVYCSTRAYINTHYYKCNGCGVKTGDGQTKMCTRSHQYCPKEYGLCK